MDSILMGSSPESATLAVGMGVGAGAGVGGYGAEGGQTDGSRQGIVGDLEHEEGGGEGEESEEGIESCSVKVREDSKHGNRESDNIS
jgi:hypothetical protein